MPSTKYTGKFEVGQRVRYSYFTAAMSCQSCVKIAGEAMIVGLEEANGTTMYALEDRTLVFECEVKRFPSWAAALGDRVGMGLLP